MQVTRRNKRCRGKTIRRKTCRGHKGRRYDCPLELTGSQITVTHNGTLQKNGTLSVTNEHIYINRDHGHGRLLESLPLKVKATFNDAAQSFRIGGTRVKIPSCRAYERVKEYLLLPKELLRQNYY